MDPKDDKELLEL